MAPVSLKNLTKSYGAVPVVHGIDLDVTDREFIAPVGPSGGGKSTTLRTIAGLEDVTGGEIRIGGRLVNDLPPRSRNISMVFLMELHVSLTCAIQNGRYVEYIPQLDELTGSRMRIEEGYAFAPSTPGIGIDWDWEAVKARSIAEFTTTIAK